MTVRRSEKKTGRKSGRTTIGGCKVKIARRGRTTIEEENRKKERRRLGATSWSRAEMGATTNNVCEQIATVAPPEMEATPCTGG
ncbi:hypothetical protein SESBI_43056 [Sesbania bispinosa]|nr:hypothetical protein SESBI_43056 [Sesbania bispinosa]